MKSIGFALSIPVFGGGIEFKDGDPAFDPMNRMIDTFESVYKAVDQPIILFFDDFQYYLKTIGQSEILKQAFTVLTQELEYDIMLTICGNLTTFEGVQEIFIENANHIPLPRIPAIFQLEDLIEKFYPILKMLSTKGKPKEERLFEIKGVFQTFMQESGIDLNTYFESGEDYSIIDYFAEKPVHFPK